MIRVLRIVRDRHARERLHANLTGMLALALISGLLALTACVCPADAKGCPRLPIRHEPHS